MEEEKYLKKQRIYKTIMLVVLTAFITCLLTTIYIGNKFDLIGGENDSISSLINNIKDDTTSDNIAQSLKNIKKIIDKYYLNDYEEQDLIDGALEGYIAALGDIYTEYIPADEMQEYTEKITGNFVGIGIYMTADTEKNLIKVILPIKESPAEEAGILSGDYILKVDGVEYKGDEMSIASAKIKGEENTKVKLEILRGEEILEFEIERKHVTTNPILSKKIENNIGYLEVSSFDEGVAEDFKNKFLKLKEQGITSLIIDLRDNGGGIVDEALKMLDYIVPKGKEILVTVDKEGKEDVRTSKEDILIDMPIVVLVNGNSASASEIFAGALKDLNEAKIVGTKTYGKGVIQSLMTFRDGSGLKITIEEYYTPNRLKINGVGIEPNVVVENKNLEKDIQLEKAIEELK